jgi:hypothetical protein
MVGVAAVVVVGGCGGGSKPTASNTVPAQVAPLTRAVGTGGLGAIAPTIVHVTARANAAVLPPPIRPVFPHPLPGEGIWRPTGPSVNGSPPVLVTRFRPERAYPDIVAYVAWFDHTRTQIGLTPAAPSRRPRPCEDR